MALDGENRGRVGGVEGEKVGQALADAERLAQHFWGEAAAAHAEQDGAGDACLAQAVAQIGEARQRVTHRVGDGQPAEAVGDLALLGGVGLPEGRVFGPDALGEALALGAAKDLLNRARERAQAGRPFRRATGGLTGGHLGGEGRDLFAGAFQQ